MASIGSGIMGDSHQAKGSISQKNSPFQINIEELNDINDHKSMDLLNNSGGVGQIAKKISTNLDSGINTSQLETSIKVRQEYFGKNALAEILPKSFISLVIEQLSDPIIILLIIAATVSTVLGVAIEEERENQAWIDGVAIWVAVLIVAFVGATNDYQKDQQFRKLNAEKETFDVSVIRNNKEQLVKNVDLVVGDILVLNTGDRVTADGLLFYNNDLVIDEASLTGESDPIKKKINSDPFCRSGTQVSDGSGNILVIAVGENSEWGKTLSLVTGDSDETPLQEKLGELAAAIGKLGFAVACLSFIVLLIRWMIEVGGWDWSLINEDGPIQFFLFAVTIVVVAVPEGLPLAVTISLAYSMRKMMKDNNFVRVLDACETMGGATAICSDKTGTLTENRMTVVEGWFHGKKFVTIPDASELIEFVKEHFVLNASLNSKAFLILDDIRNPQFVGNRTECALMMLALKWGDDYRNVRKHWEKSIIKFYGFNSSKKMASIVIKINEDRIRLYNKGAPEMVLKLCTRFYNNKGEIEPLDDAKFEELNDIILDMATRGLRTLALTYNEFDMSDFAFNHEDSSMFPSEDPIGDKRGFKDSPDEDLILIAIVGIKDPVRTNVPEAVSQCRSAGINVRMVTGDNVHTAEHIARECGILREGDSGGVMEGPEFRQLCATEDEHVIMEKIENLHVLARSTPTDKHTLVSLLRKKGDVVAVTGDGTNDAPALKESDVGLAMGIAGTEVAKEAADIVIMDDNFSSIVKAVLWGRAVFNNIRKFLQFQLTVNVVALGIAFFAAVVGGETPLNVLQLLWVNLIMDTLAALALATENPTPDLLTHKPHGREESLISSTMWKHIFLISGYQLTVLFVILYGFPSWMERYEEPSKNEAYCDWCDLHFDNPWNENYNVTDMCCNYFKENDCNEIECQGSSVPVDSTELSEFVSYLDDEEIAEKAIDDALLRKNSLIFNVFIFMQIFNEINSRKIMDEYNILDNITDSSTFIIIFIIITGMQVLIMLTPIKMFFKATDLTSTEWLISLLLGFGVIPFDMLIRFISNSYNSSHNKSIN